MNAQPKRAARYGHNFGKVSLRGGESAMVKRNRTGLPDRLKAGIERLSGVSLDDVRVHRASAAPSRVWASAYTRGTDIHVGAGQERHLAHEAWHVVQQKQGRVKQTTQLQGLGINDDDALEREADVMGARASGSTYAVAGRALNAIVPSTTVSVGKTSAAAPLQAKGKSKSWKRRREARLAAEREVRREAATTIQSAYRGHLGRRRADLTRSLMDNANRLPGGQKFDIQRTFKPGETRADLADRTLFRRHGEDEPDNPRDRRRYTSYTQYDQRGGPLRRVDVTGASHGGVPTPHVLEYTPTQRQLPARAGGGTLTQYSAPEKNSVRPAHYWEVPPLADDDE
jgi:hypothetical protein